MQERKRDLTLEAFAEPRKITLNVSEVSPSNLTLLEALDISDAANIEPDEFVSTMTGRQTRKQALLMYALAWVMARRVEPGLTFEEVCTYQLEVKGKPLTTTELERGQKRADAVAGVAMLANVSPDEAEGMTLAEVTAVTSITKARMRRTHRRR